MQRKGDSLELRFAHAKGLKAKDGDLKSFLIAGADKKFVPAEARIQRGKVVVRSDAVQEPAAVRYGWADWTPANLYNGAGLPASPFRTDDWPETK
jgi:sialate O-acetylesterase